MKILYLSCHEGLQYDEVSLFEELGHEVECISHFGVINKSNVEPRPGLKGVDLTHGINKIVLDPKYVEQFDIVYVTHYFEWIMDNWPAIYNKKVILRIWQTEHHNMHALTQFRQSGLTIVRYSNLTCYMEMAGRSPHDCIIRTYKDPNEFNNWLGTEKFVMTTCNDMQSRPRNCYLETYQNITNKLPRKLFGRNNDILNIPGGFVTYKQLKDEYRNNAVYLYLGTHPAPYTLNFVEAFMTGIPVVSIGSVIADISRRKSTEVPEFMTNGVDGFVSDDENILHKNIVELLHNPELANKIGKAGRETAIRLFGKETIKKQWEKLFSEI